MLCLDNIDAWCGDSVREQALFSLVERVKQCQWPMVVTANDKPLGAGFELADLVSRLQSGVVFRIAELDDLGKLQAMRERVQQYGLVVNDEGLRYLLTYYARDNHSLFQAIQRLDAASMVAKRKITIPFIQQVLFADPG